MVECDVFEDPCFYFLLVLDERANGRFTLHYQDYALKIITETNESWAKLVKRSIAAGELSLV